ncbi:MAG: hypothetical protein KBA60_02750, partial [Flavobacteriales bacterium]|nr:hypothetical protein [Flavobacteriales bacterium]
MRNWILVLALLGFGVPGSFAFPPPFHTDPPKQGLIDLLMDYMGSKYPAVDASGDLLYISVERQSLFHVRSGRLLAEYRIATARAGLGSTVDSYRTPMGL